jgi:aspartyl-tRNA(Asn)/glutamyl-tRNA(Gln) amidotransferase subunit B
MMNNKWEAVIGLEIHVQMKTNTKMFCGCKVSFGDEPNTNVCPVCLGLPGALPVINKKAVEYGIKAALALNCEVQPYSVFARKHYFYPDLPKGYQISQYEAPLATNGFLEIENEEGQTKKIRIKRLHLEEDAGKNIHEGKKTYVDLNRAGTPLMEIVTQPDISSPSEARIFLENLRNIMRYLGVSDADMEKGQLRCDINVSIRPKGSKELGTRVEIKNVNSFRFVQKALEYEIERQIKLKERGEKIEQETRTFDPATGKTYSMRGKEEAEDYRYFPDPDLVPLKISVEYIENLRKNLPELPHQRLKRYIESLGLAKKVALPLVNYKEYGDYFEEVLRYYPKPKEVANWLLNDLLGNLREKNIAWENNPITPKKLAELLQLIEKGVISVKIAKELLKEMINTGKSASQLVEEKGLKQITDEEAIKEIVKEVLKENPDAVEKYRKGIKKVIGFLVGQVMRKTRGKANPKLVNKVLTELLEEG